MLLKGKSWIAQEFYNEYLQLKVSISSVSQEIDYLKGRYPDSETLEEKIKDQDSLIKQFKFVIQQLNERKVKTEDLLLLSMGVDLE